MIWRLVFLGLLGIYVINAQSIILAYDNDVLLFNGQDRYYTHGLKIGYSWQPIEKNWHTLKINQLIFNPLTGKNPLPKNHDRPFAGLILLDYTKTGWLNDQLLFSWGGSVGNIGPNTFSEQLQSEYHELIGLYSLEGWEYQIQNSWVATLNTEIQYSKPLSSHLEWNNKAKLTAGYNKNEVQLGTGIRVSWIDLQLANHSGFFNPNQRNREGFIYLNFNIYAQFYDAVIQGDMLSTNSPVTRSIRPIYYDYQLGYYLITKNGWHWGFAFIQQPLQPIQYANLYYKSHQWGQISIVIPVISKSL